MVLPQSPWYIPYPEGAINRFHLQNLTYLRVDKVVTSHAMKAYQLKQNYTCSSTHSERRPWMEVSGQIYTTAIISHGKEFVYQLTHLRK